MTSEIAIELARRAVLVTILLGIPVMAVALLVGILISLLQAVTQVQDQTLSFAPKMIAIWLTILITLPWAINVMVEYSTELFQGIPGNL